MIKYLLLFGIFGLTTFLGFEFSKTYTKKTHFYNDILTFCKVLKSEISFLKTDILTIISRERYESDLSKILTQISSKMESSNGLNKEDIQQILTKYSFLSSKDNELLCGLFCNLGRLSYQEQIAELEYYIACFDEESSKQQEKSIKMAPLCKKMGILIGITICILLI